MMLKISGIGTGCFEFLVQFVQQVCTVSLFESLFALLSHSSISSERLGTSSVEKKGMFFQHKMPYLKRGISTLVFNIIFASFSPTAC